MEALRRDLPVHGVGAVAAVRAVVERVRHRDVARVDVPALLELLAVPVVRDERRARVVAAGEDRRRRLPVEVRDAGQEAVDAVAGLDAGHGVVAPEQTVVAATRLVVDGLELLAGRPREHREVLGTVDDEALEVAQHVAGAAAGGVDVDEVVGERRRVLRRQRVRVLRRDAERRLDGRRPVARDDLGVAAPALEHGDQVVEVALLAQPVVDGVGDAGVAVALGQRRRTSRRRRFRRPCTA